ncbi:MAG: hypothetical protein ACJATI_004046 [Halioglobus sp.]|jgi:hypothetical protein
MILNHQITHIFCVVDEFMIEFQPQLDKYSLGNKPKRKPKLSTFEVMTIMILFQLSGIRCFKWFYNQYLVRHLSHDFPNLVTYNLFVEL